MVWIVSNLFRLIMTWRNYGASLIVISDIESSNNCHGWESVNDSLKMLRLTKTQIKSFQHAKAGCFKKLDRGVCDYLTEKWNKEMPITGADFLLKALEITKELNMPTVEFKVCVNDWSAEMDSASVAGLLAQRFLSDFREKLLILIESWFSLRW